MIQLGFIICFRLGTFQVFLMFLCTSLLMEDSKRNLVWYLQQGRRASSSECRIKWLQKLWSHLLIATLALRFTRFLFNLVNLKHKCLLMCDTEFCGCSSTRLENWIRLRCLSNSLWGWSPIGLFPSSSTRLVCVCLLLACRPQQRYRSSCCTLQLGFCFVSVPGTKAHRRKLSRGPRGLGWALCTCCQSPGQWVGP